MEGYHIILILLGVIIICSGIYLILTFYMPRLVDRRIAVYQNDLVTKHCEEVQNIYQQMRGWRHDYHNHIQTMKAYLSLGQQEELLQYMGKLDADLTSVDTVLKTGNVMIDAILNSKLSLAKSRDIKVNAKAIVPKNLPISEIDLCVIIGNLLDNSMEACMKLDNEERFIRVYLDILKNQLYLSVTNSAGGEIKKEEKQFITTKGGSHGFGLMRVDKIADKYNGYVNRQSETGVFATEIMLPLS